MILTHGKEHGAVENGIFVMEHTKTEILLGRVLLP